MGKGGTTGSPKRCTSTLALSSGPMGTEGSIIWGITSMILWISRASSSSRPSSQASRSASAFTSAFRASASASLEGSFLAWPMSIPTCLLLALRAVRRSWASWMVARFSLSRAITWSTRGSFSS